MDRIFSYIGNLYNANSQKCLITIGCGIFAIIMLHIFMQSSPLRDLCLYSLMFFIAFMERIRVTYPEAIAYFEKHEDLLPFSMKPKYWKILLNTTLVFLLIKNVLQLTTYFLTGKLI